MSEEFDINILENDEIRQKIFSNKSFIREMLKLKQVYERAGKFPKWKVDGEVFRNANDLKKQKNEEYTELEKDNIAANIYLERKLSEDSSKGKSLIEDAEKIIQTAILKEKLQITFRVKPKDGVIALFKVLLRRQGLESNIIQKEDGGIELNIIDVLATNKDKNDFEDK